ncbi:MAG: PCYCGC motif-containing (lipo)protein [Anaerolineales bacterium]
MTASFRRLSLLLVTLTLILSGALSACATGTDHTLSMASMADMPADVQTAPVSVQQAYQFAFANPEEMTQIPCYCGCGSMGHTSNYSCYISDVGADGTLTYDNHALGCSICVDITQDAMRMLRDGKTVPEIRAHVDQTYSKFGPSNMP